MFAQSLNLGGNTGEAIFQNRGEIIGRVIEDGADIAKRKSSQTVTTDLLQAPEILLAIDPIVPLRSLD